MSSESAVFRHSRVRIALCVVLWFYIGPGVQEVIHAIM